MSVRSADSAADLRTFIDFPYRHYRDDPLWVPQLRRDVETLLSRTKNPFFEHADMACFLAERPGGAVVGRIAAIKNDAHGQVHPEEATVGFFGMFESVDDQAVADALFAAAAGWLGQRGLTVMRGPMNLSTNDDCGLLVDGFTTPPVVMMPHNPRYYQGLVERAGFTKAMDLLAYFGGRESVPERLRAAGPKLAKRYNISLRPLSKKRFWSDVALVDNNCAAKVKANPDAHTKDCAIKCQSSGYAVVTADGSVLKLDATGNKEAEAALKAYGKPDHLRVTVTGDREGETIKVKSLKM